MVVYTVVISFVFLWSFPPLRSYKAEKNAKKALAALEVLGELATFFAFFAG
jgi:hypothetical protein